MSKWRPIETAPKDKQLLFFEEVTHHPIVANEDGTYHIGDAVILARVYIGQWRREDGLNRAGWADSLNSFANPTHWMTLPPPPVT